MDAPASPSPAQKLRVIDTGDHYFTHPGYPYLAPSRESLVAKGFPAAEVDEHDTLLTLRQVHHELRAILNPIINGKDSHFDWNMEYFGPAHNRGNEKWPRDASIAVYPHRGGSEGWIVNVASMVREKDGKMSHDVLLWGKMFGGKDEVWRVTRLIADALGIL